MFCKTTFNYWIKRTTTVKNNYPLHVVNVDLHTNDPCSVKRGLNASAKNMDPDKPVKSAETDQRQNFSVLVNFLHIKQT